MALGELKTLIAENVPHTNLLPLMPEKSLFQSLQQKGVILFDDPASEYTKRLTNYEARQKRSCPPCLIRLSLYKKLRESFKDGAFPVFVWRGFL